MTLIRGVLLVVCFSVPVFGQEAEDRREVNFARADLDQDGHVSREEFKGNQDNFDQFDANGDGFVTREEFGLKPVTTSKKPAVVPSEQTEEEKRLMAGDNENTTPRGPQSAKGISIPLSVSPIQELRTTAEDGRTAEASYRMPPGDGPFPAIVFEHGGLGYSNQERRQSRLIDGSVQTRFLSMGYVAVEGTKRDHNDNPTDPGPILDYKAIVDAVRNMEKVDSESNHCDGRKWRRDYDAGSNQYNHCERSRGGRACFGYLCWNVDQASQGSRNTVRGDQRSGSILDS